MPSRNIDPSPRVIRWETSEARHRCFYVNNHTPCPDGFVAWHEWAEKKSKTHEQVQCPGCGLYAIWRTRSVPSGPATKEES